MTTFVVLNPEAGGCDDPEACRRTLAGLPGAEVHVSDSADDARSAVARAVGAGADTVVAAGGDGTVHAVLNGLAPRPERVRFAVVPLGTADDFARSLSLPTGLEEAVEVIRAGRTRALDVLEVQPRPDGGRDHFLCANLAAGGFAGGPEEGPEGELEGVKERWGPLSYVRVAAESLGDDLRVWRTELRLAGTTVVRDLLNLIVANGRYAGGGVPLAPDADPADGLLNVVSIGGMSAADLALLAPRVLAGEHGGADGVVARRARAVRVRSEPRMPFSVDGEKYRFERVDFRVRPGALRTMVPPEEA